MEVIKPGITYKVFNYSDKAKYTIIRFVEKIHKKVVLEEPDTKEIYVDGIVQFSDGITSEELIYLLLDRFKYLNDKHYSKQNETVIQSLKTIIGALKDRKKIKQENKKRYEQSFQVSKEVEQFQE